MSYWVLGCLALAVTTASVPIIRLWLVRSNVIDHPNERSSHQNAVPRGGGIACLLGVVAGIGLAAVLGVALNVIAVCAALALAAVGLVDDIRRLPAAPRLALQVLIGTSAGAALGGLEFALLGALVAPVVVNVVNFMDGINGLTAMNMAVWGVGVAVGAGAAGVNWLAVIGAVTAGSSLGFLPWNAPKASIFLGDVGSYFFGGIVLIGILGGLDSHVTLGATVAPLLIPVVDVALTLVSRALRRQPLTQAHREHTYQRVTGHGVSHASASLAIAGLSAVLAYSWATLHPLVAFILTIIVLSLYLSWPRILSHRKAVDDTPTK